MTPEEVAKELFKRYQTIRWKTVLTHVPSENNLHKQDKAHITAITKALTQARSEEQEIAVKAQRLIADLAIQKERERCARIAEQLNGGYGIGYDIAKAIQKQDEVKL